MMRSTQLWRRWPVWLFGVFWVVGVAYFAFEYMTNPYEPSPEGPLYGRTSPGELARMLKITAVEVLVATALLRPWSYRRSWGRALIAAAVFAPYSFIRMGIGMHGGPATAAHTIWLLLFCIGLGGAAIVSGVAAARAQGHSTSVGMALLAFLTFTAGGPGLAVSQTAWQPSPGHRQIPIWPGVVPDARPVEGPEVSGTVVDDATGSKRLVGGKPWVYVAKVSQPTIISK